MTLAGGDLTTPARVGVWIPNLGSGSSAIIAQLITSCSALIRNKLNRPRLNSRNYTRTFNGQGNPALILPDWPVTAISSIQLGSALINPYPLPNPVSGASTSTFGYGYRAVLWAGDLPGDPTMIEFVNGYFRRGLQNVQVSYTAGYAVLNEAQTIPGGGGNLTVLQPLGVCSANISVAYAATGVLLTAVASGPTVGQYIAPVDATPGQYTFAAADANVAILVSYSFVPAELEEATIQMVAERYSYRGRIGELSKSLGGQETVSFLRGGKGRGIMSDLPPEIEALIQPYVSVISPATGADT